MSKRFPATYFDGQTAQPWSVEIELSRKSVDIFDDDGRKLSSWPLRNISRVPPMLEEAVAALQDSDEQSAVEDRWSPQINIGTSVLIPDSYVQDLDVRLGLYRRLSELDSRQAIDAFAAELIDRFGALPEEVDHLLEIVTIKQLCFAAGVEKVDAGPKGATVSFRNNEFANPAGLVEYIGQSEQDVKLRPDQKLVFRRSWPEASQRLKGVKLVLGVLSEIAEEADAAA